MALEGRVELEPRFTAQPLVPDRTQHRVAEADQLGQGVGRRQTLVAADEVGVSEDVVAALKDEGRRLGGLVDGVEIFRQLGDADQRNQDADELAVALDRRPQIDQRLLERRRPHDLRPFRSGQLPRPVDYPAADFFLGQVDRIAADPAVETADAEELEFGVDEDEGADLRHPRHRAVEIALERLAVLGAGDAAGNGVGDIVDLGACRRHVAADAVDDHRRDQLHLVARQGHRVLDRAPEAEAEHADDRDRDQKAEAEDQRRGHRQGALGAREGTAHEGRSRGLPAGLSGFNAGPMNIRRGRRVNRRTR